jgi:hypothetical protein
MSGRAVRCALALGPTSATPKELHLLSGLGCVRNGEEMNQKRADDIARACLRELVVAEKDMASAPILPLGNIFILVEGPEGLDIDGFEPDETFSDERTKKGTRTCLKGKGQEPEGEPRMWYRYSETLRAIPAFADKPKP